MNLNPNPMEREDDDPQRWHRTPCFVHDGLIVSGDLVDDGPSGLAQLREWVALGVTHVVDVRAEYTDEAFVAQHAPHVAYVWAGTHDSGGAQPDEWFDAVLDGLRVLDGLGGLRVLDGLGGALFSDEAVVLVHCHMGVNRGPSMALRLLLEQGWDVVTALDEIRRVRPIAAVLYARDALDHYHRRHGIGGIRRDRDAARVRDWLSHPTADVAWILSRMREAS